MMTNDEKLVLFIIVLLCTVGGGMVGSSVVESGWQFDTAQTECAQFSPKTGQFEWIPKKLDIPSS
jgi:hypothetical protein